MPKIKRETKTARSQRVAHILEAFLKNRHHMPYTEMD